MDKLRWRYGDTSPAMRNVLADTVIEIGDLLYEAAPNQVAPACHLTDPAEFVESFAGVAMQRSWAGETKPIRVATTGVFSLDCAEANWEAGQLVGLAIAPSGHLQNQVVSHTAEKTLAIGRCAMRSRSTFDAVLVDIVTYRRRDADDGGEQCEC